MAAAEILPSADSMASSSTPSTTWEIHGTLGNPHLHQVAGGDEGEADHHPVEVVEGRLRQLGKGVHLSDVLPEALPHVKVAVLHVHGLSEHVPHGGPGGNLHVRHQGLRGVVADVGLQLGPHAGVDNSWIGSDNLIFHTNYFLYYLYP